MYFDDFQVGQEWVTASQTIEHSDVMAFAGLTGDHTQLHTSEEVGRKSIFGRRVAHGLLGLSISIGLLTRLGLMEESVMAYLGLNHSFSGPIFLGDSVQAKIRVGDKKETKKADRGIVQFHIQLLNQRGEVVQIGEHTMMLARRPASSRQ